MKILHIIPSISKKRGGPSTAIISMVRALRDEGIDAAILTTNDNVNYRDEQWPLARWFWINEVPVIMFSSVQSSTRLISEYLISPMLSWWLIQNINNYDALHIHSIFSYTSTTSMLIARIKKVPYVVRTIGQLNAWSLSQSRLRKFLMLSIIEKSNLMASVGIHVTSDSEMVDLKLVCHHRNVLCLELGVDIPLIDKLKSKSTNHVTSFVFLSRIHPKKQLDLLLKAFGYLHKECGQESWYLYIAGDGDSDYIDFLKQLALNYGISDYIEWMGHVSGESKVNLLTKSDWLVLPSKSENFGLSVVEALAQGVPVIISKEVGISDLVKKHNAGLVCESSSDLPKLLAIALQGSTMQMKYAALELAQEKFSWSKIGKKLKSFYASRLKTTNKT